MISRLILLSMIFITTPFLMGTSCNKTSDCKDVMCTMMFVSVTVKVQTNEGVPIALDQTYTIRKSNNERIEPTQQMDAGWYAVLDDSYQKRMPNTRDSFLFVGIKDGKEIISETFLISADCCHVQKESGPEIIGAN